MTSVIDTMPSARAAPVGPVSEMVTRAYGRTELYNLRNPLSELLFIICSALTQEANYRATYASLRRSFPTMASLARASEEEIAASIARGGLSARKARGIRHILDCLAAEFGRPTLAPLRAWSDAECERFLTSLPLVGRKTARCVMLFSLDREVFPVDRHCWRISTRLGWTGDRVREAPAPTDMDALQAKIPPGLRGPLHVAMVGFGRQTCRATRPRCERCELQTVCPSRHLDRLPVRPAWSVP
jgi:endonuclease III